MASYSRQGINIAFIGFNLRAQISCAEYLKRRYNFKRINMEESMVRFIKGAYGYGLRKNMSYRTRLAFYDSIYRVDNEIFINYVQNRMDKSYSDTVIPNVRYVNEMEALKKMGFIICRVTTNVKQLPIGELSKNAEPGTTAVAMAYDRRFSVNNPSNYSVHWTSVATTPQIMESFLTRIGYKT